MKTLIALLLSICAAGAVTNQTEIVNFSAVYVPTNGEYLVTMTITNTVPGASYLLLRNANSMPDPFNIVAPAVSFTATNTSHPIRLFQLMPIHFYRVQNQ